MKRINRAGRNVVEMLIDLDITVHGLLACAITAPDEELTVGCEHAVDFVQGGGQMTDVIERRSADYVLKSSVQEGHVLGDAGSIDSLDLFGLCGVEQWIKQGGVFAGCIGWPPRTGTDVERGASLHMYGEEVFEPLHIRAAFHGARGAPVERIGGEGVVV